MKLEYSIAISNTSEFSFPKTKNNYKGLTIENCEIPKDMPKNYPFSSISIIPNPILSLKTRKISNNQKLFINIVQHDEVPLIAEGSAPCYVLMDNSRDIGDETLVIDAAIHSSVWSGDEQQNQNEQVCYMCAHKYLYLYCILLGY